MVVIRLARNGKKHNPVYKIMVAHKETAATGRYIERVGMYNPRKAYEGGVDLNKERYDHWVSKGAIPSQTVSSLVKKIEADGFAKRPEVKAKKKAAPAKEETKEETKADDAAAETKKADAPAAETKDKKES